jgi:glycosyltransferase involved in cell wall biosynthesis
MSTNSPFFSVVIPTYNRAGSILEAVDSVLVQDHPNLELLVVDDGSTDNTGELLKARAQTDPRLRYIFQENAERSRARNNGIDQAEGQYICFLDSDDVYLENHLSSFYKELEKREFPVVMLYGNPISEVDGKRVEEIPYKTTTGLPVESFIKSAVPSQTTCIHRQILSEFKYDPDFKIGEDVELFCRVASKYPIEHISAYTAVIRDLGDRTIDIRDMTVYTESARVIKHVWKVRSNDVISREWIRFALSSIHYKRALQHLKRNEKFAYVYQMLVSIAISPTHFLKDKIKGLITFKVPTA